MVRVEKLNFVDIMFKYFRFDWDRRNNLEETMINLLHETELKELAHRALDQNNGLDGYIYETLLKDDRANQLRDFVIGLLSKDENEELSNEELKSKCLIPTKMKNSNTVNC